MLYSLRQSIVRLMRVGECVPVGCAYRMKRLGKMPFCSIILLNNPIGKTCLSLLRCYSSKQITFKNDHLPVCSMSYLTCLRIVDVPSSDARSVL